MQDVLELLKEIKECFTVGKVPFVVQRRLQNAIEQMEADAAKAANGNGHKPAPVKAKAPARKRVKAITTLKQLHDLVKPYTSRSMPVIEAFKVDDGKVTATNLKDGIVFEAGFIPQMYTLVDPAVVKAIPKAGFDDWTMVWKYTGCVDVFEQYPGYSTEKKYTRRTEEFSSREAAHQAAESLPVGEDEKSRGEPYTVATGYLAIEGITFETIDADEAPIVDGELKDVLWEADFTLETLKAISEVGHAASKDGSRPVFQTVLLHPQPSGMNVVAVDGWRLAKLFVEGDYAPKEDMMIDAESLVKVVKTLTAVGVEQVSLKLGRGEVGGVKWVISGEGDLGKVTIISEAVEGSFPDYNRIIPSDRKGGFVADRLVLAETAKVASNLCQTNDALDFMTFHVHGNLKVTATAGVKELNGWSAEAGESPEGMIDFAINPKLLADALAWLDGDTVLIQSERPSYPIKIETGNKTVVIMPMHAS